MEGILYFVLCVAFLYTLVQLPVGGHTAGQESKSGGMLAYPVDEIVSSYLTNARNRTPVYIPGKCSKNEILYPGDHETDWVCDCRPGYVYYPQHDACYELYTKGFCEAGEYVDLARPSMLVKCTTNICTEPNKVPFRGQCVVLDRHHESCPKVNRKRFIVGVNSTTLELDCIEGAKVPVNTRFDDNEEEQIPAPSNIMLFEGAKLCSNGTKATYSGLCA